MVTVHPAMEMGRPVSKLEQLESQVAALKAENERLKKSRKIIVVDVNGIDNLTADVIRKALKDLEQ